MTGKIEYRLPTGEIIVQDNKDERVKAYALKLGLINQLARLVKGPGQRLGVASILDGDKLVCIMQWAGFEKKQDNGWVSVCAIANENTSKAITRMVENASKKIELLEVVPINREMCRN